MEQSVSAGKVSMLVSVPYPPDMMRPAIIELIRTVCLVTLLDQLYELQIKITFTIVSIAGGGLGKVEEGEEEKSCPKHPHRTQERNLDKQ